MSCRPCEEKAREREGMTRGKFLGMGAAAAAGMGAAGLGVEETEGQELGPCVKPSADTCGPGAPRTWEIPASVLQVLWGEIFPRLVAFKWSQGKVNTFDTNPVDPVDLRTEIQTFMAHPDGGNAPPATSQFAKRVGLVTTYLGGNGGLIPVRYWGPGQFDFILSDAGLDLFSPMWPTTEPEMLRFYQYRAAGRGTLGIPGYLDGAKALAFDVQSPTGPSQIWTNASDNTVIGPGSCTLGQLNCLERGSVPDFPGLPPSAGIRPPEAPFVPNKRFPLGGFIAAASAVRCWQLEGAVYRGILEQLPRVIATIWREHYTNTVIDGSYYKRWFGMIPLAGPDIRGIFKERLETSLPEPGWMLFDAVADLEDVTITNQGLLFPQLRNPPDAPDPAPGLPAPDWLAMVKGISKGRAGNPVFTDSRRPPGDI